MKFIEKRLRVSAIMFQANTKQLKRFVTTRGCCNQYFEDIKSLTTKPAKYFSKTHKSINAQKWISRDPNLDLSKTMRIMSYNILAGCNVRPRLYPNVPKEDLCWETRHRPILKYHSSHNDRNADLSIKRDRNT